MKTINRIILMLSLIIISIMISEAGENNTDDTGPITYVSYVDNGFGFYKARDVTTYKPAPLDPSTHTLTIKQGDRVIWKNDAERGISITVVSEQGLFTDADLKSNFQYNFEQTGTFTFHVKEYPGRKFTVIVNSDGTYPASTYIPTPTYTPTYTYTPTPYPTHTSSTANTNSANSTYPANTYPTHTPSTTTNIDYLGYIIGIISDIHIPVKITPATIMSIIVAITSIYITRRIGKS